MLRVSHVTFEYPNNRALFDVSFDIAKGAIVALVGPNGAGKTTLLQCLAGLLRPFMGNIGVNGINIIENPRKCQAFIGFLPDFFGLYDRLTVRQTLIYFAKAHLIPNSRLRSQLEQVAAWIHLTDRLDAPVGELSRGMRQRLGIGIAMIHDQDLLLLDEPASGLDPEARYALSGLFMELNRMGKTLIVSSHILAELAQYATEMIVLQQGRLVEKTVVLGPQSTRRHLCVEASEPIVAIPECIWSHGSVSDARLGDGQLFFQFSGSLEDRHTLLRHMLESGIPVTAFFEKKETVEDQYLHMMGRR